MRKMTTLTLICLAAMWSIAGCGGTTPAPATENTFETCTDDVDNDGDQLADCDDPDCQVFLVCGYCGDGEIQDNEECDGDNLDLQDCLSLELGFTGGNLACDGCVFDTSDCATCGNDQIETGETCDGDNLDLRTCATLGMGFTSGNLACNACAFDTAACTTCGDDQIETGEDCEGDNLDLQTCQTLGLGFTGGNLACDECAFDTSDCATCGNNQIETGEICDGYDLDLQTCETLGLGFTGGNLACDECAFDTTDCATCGNDQVETGEVCDGDNLDLQTCETLGLGFTGGNLACDGCAFDTTDCATCGNDQVETGEVCDGDNLDLQTCQTLGLGFTGGNLACDECAFDTADCATCGNEDVETGEVCDGDNLNLQTCETLGLGFTGGNLACDECAFDTADCATCGNEDVETGEVCDGDNLNLQTCETLGLGFTGGNLACDGCAFDTADCATCGNGEIETGEVCDTDNLNLQTCETMGMGFTGGNLACDECAFDTADCATCGNDEVETGEDCDGDNLNLQTCQTIGQGYTGGNLACDACAFDTADCATCGNDEIETGEVCDDGNSEPDLTCSADCTMVCEPLFGVCNGNESTYCLPDGSGTTTEACDPFQGMNCDAGSGRCSGSCSAVDLGTSYVGCDFFATITNNQVSSSFLFAVTVSNPGDTTANVTVTQGASIVTTTTVDPGTVEVVTLAWVNELKSAATALVNDGAYRVRTDQPVAVYQYSPIDYTNGSGGYSYTNDASLLLPTHTWSGDYMVVARNHMHMGASQMPGHYAVTAMHDDTIVTLTPSASGGYVQAGAGVNADGTGTLTLNEGDVLHVASASNAPIDPMSCVAWTCYNDESDLTGTTITADKPVQVVGGHTCTFIPYYVPYCDHLEESIPPLHAVGFQYIVTPPLIQSGAEKAQMIRVVATEDNTSIVYEPPQAGRPDSLAAAGDYFEIDQSLAGFMITADKKILVAQYMLGQNAGGNTGDPAMAMAVPVGQYRSDYLFHAPANYEANYVNITAPSGASLTLDGAPVAGFTAIGSSGYSVAKIQVSNAGDGNHVIVGDSPFGISVYGYGQYTSYWFPGGSELSEL
jgi:IgGFc binding protein